MKEWSKDYENETLKEIFKVYLWPRKGKMFLIVFLIVGGVILGNLSPMIYGWMVDAINGLDLDQLALLIGVYCGITLFTLGLELLEKYLGEVISFQITNSIKIKLFEKIVQSKCKEYSRFTTGEYISRLNGDSESIVTFFVDLITSFGQVVINLGISIVFIISISLRLSSVALFYLPASFAVTFIARKYYKKLAGKQRKVEDRHYSFLTEVFSNFMGIKAFQMEQIAAKKYWDIVLARFDLVKKSLRLGNVTQVFNSIVKLASSMYIIYISAVLIKNGNMTLGTMISFNTYINVMFSSVSEIWNFNISKQSVLVAAGRIRDILETEIEELQEEKCQLFGIKSDLLIKDLSFSYPSTESFALHKLNLHIQGPGIYALVGRNGCGKSTLAKILVRFYDLDKGSYQLAGRPCTQYSLKALRSHITYIQKDDFFLKDTVYQNLILARKTATKEEVYDACRHAGIHDFIMSMPEQYQTILDEEGSNLSSGQKQMLSIARAILRGSDILVLDEITANLDGKAEKRLLEVLEYLRRDKTILLISHKITSILSSDRIFVMDNGNIIAAGTHCQLIQTCNLYQELFGSSQSN